MSDFATPADVALAWRPLSAAEEERAAYWCEVASRRVRNRWPDVDERVGLAPGEPRRLDPKDVRDVVVPLVVEVLGGPPVPGAVSWSTTTVRGDERTTQSVTLATTRDGSVFADWMVAVFEGRPLSVLPLGAFPPSGRFDPLFEWKE